MVDGAELGQQEVEHGALAGLGPVGLPRDANLGLRLLADLDGDVDLGGRLLRGLQALDKRHVGQNVLGRVREPLEEVVLELHELDLVLHGGSGQLLALGLEVGPLLADDLGEQLVLQAPLGGDEVDEST